MDFSCTFVPVKIFGVQKYMNRMEIQNPYPIIICEIPLDVIGNGLMLGHVRPFRVKQEKIIFKGVGNAYNVIPYAERLNAIATA